MKFYIFEDVNKRLPAMSCKVNSMILVNLWISTVLTRFRPHLFSGVRQKTVRQLSTMDNPGTLPIYVYNNTEVEQHDRISLEQEETAPVLIPDNDEDDIPLVSVRQKRTRTGRVSRPRTCDDMILH